MKTSRARIFAALFLIIGILLGWFIYNTEKPTTEGERGRYSFKLGLDLLGGSQLTYSTDISGIESSGRKDALEALRDVIERRINTFGVSEPVVQLVSPSALGSDEGGDRLVVELPGVTDLDQAIDLIGATPLLQFKLARSEDERDRILSAIAIYSSQKERDPSIVPTGDALLDPYFKDTELTGRYLKRATLQFSQGQQFTQTPIVALEFDDNGTKLFAEITKANSGQVLAIYLDGSPISIPVINEPIENGQAVITGNFQIDEAKELVGRLNSGALPIPITLLSTEKIGASLGSDAIEKGLLAGVWGFVIVALFMILYYRLPGLISVLGLSFYVILSMIAFKFLGVTLTAAGIAGFIMTIGIAVDANVVIFERMREERASGKSVPDSIEQGFARAWPSIRDANISSLITSAVLFWFGTSVVKGFALTFGIGTLASMVSAIIITRMLIRALGLNTENKFTKVLYGVGLER